VPPLRNLNVTVSPDDVSLGLFQLAQPFYADTRIAFPDAWAGAEQLAVHFTDANGRSHRILARLSRVGDDSGDIYLLVARAPGGYRVQAFRGAQAASLQDFAASLRLKRSFQATTERSDYSLAIVTDAKRPLRGVECDFWHHSILQAARSIYPNIRLRRFQRDDGPIWRMHERLAPVPLTADVFFEDGEGERYALHFYLGNKSEVLPESFQGEIVLFLHEEEDTFQMRVFIGSHGQFSRHKDHRALLRVLHDCYTNCKSRVDLRQKFGVSSIGFFPLNICEAIPCRAERGSSLPGMPSPTPDGQMLQTNGN
jgi:hypothetical protein